MTNILKARATASARKLALAGVAPAALNESVSREAVAIAIRGAYSKATHDAVRTEYIVGRLAGILPSNETPALRIAKARLVLKMAGATGKGKLAKGQSRRTPEQERAYATVRQSFASMLAYAGIKTAEKRGGNRTPNAGQGKAKKGKGNKQPTPFHAAPKVASNDDANVFVERQAAMLLAFQKKNALRVRPALSSAISDFAAAVRSAIAAQQPA